MTFSKKHKNTSPHAGAAQHPPKHAEDSAKDGSAAEASAADGNLKEAAEAPAAADATQGDAETPAAAETAPAVSEVDQLKDRLLRLQADFDNYRKRMARERQETVALANSDLISELLTPIDHMDRALAVLTKSTGEDDACVQGVRLVRTELLSTLERFGLKGMIAEGKLFDPTQHEALGWATMPGVEEGHVAAEVRAGYTLNGRVLRAAQVMVASPPQEPEATEAPAETDTAEGEPETGPEAAPAAEGTEN